MGDSHSSETVNNVSRVEKIQEMLASDPDSEMLLYMLAMEHRKEGATGEALQVFTQLQQRQPPHVPSFFMAAQMLADDDQVEAARALLREGIEIARDQGDSHAAGEMGDLLAMLGSA